MIYFLDIEASSMAEGGFPIEIAWVDQGGLGESHLIKPADEWATWGRRQPAWAPASDSLHGVRLWTLLEHRVSHVSVAARAVEVLGQQTSMICSEVPERESRWLAMLFAAAGMKRAIKVFDVRELYGCTCYPLVAPAPSDPIHIGQRASLLLREIVTAAEYAEQARVRVRHRALPDAQGMWRTWRAIQDEVAMHTAQVA